jgi:hypothetical protein
VTAAQIRLVMRADAAFDLLLGLLLLVATWNGLYDLLRLPIAQPEIFTQAAGAILIGFAYILSQAPDEPALLRPIATGAAIANGLGAFVILVWVVTGKLGIGSAGTVLFVIVLLILVTFTFFQYRISRLDTRSWAHDDRTQPLA